MGDLVSDPMMTAYDAQRRITVEFPRRRRFVPRDPRERRGYRQMSVQELRHAENLVGAEHPRSDVGDDTDEETRDVETLRQATRSAAAENHAHGCRGCQRMRYEHEVIGERELME